ncbi:heparinase II/III domain-containing protein [Paraprevotella xylaniphila]|uniref:heparinase II/III domain-containing protein n=1 Tax=Paraprevotella xylaniphila TaxID=454155 RepID=UPI00266B45A2|nr:heparinase II/III family protein [Paraprevotella xylaniphila]
MKKFLVCVGGFCLSFSLYAQQVKHPALLFTKARVEAAKSRMESDTCMARCWEDILKVADGALKGNNFRRADYLSLAYLMTGDRRYADRLKSILQSLTDAKTWGSEEMLSRKPVWRSDLGLSHKCLMSALAYDAIYETLSGQERKDLAEKLLRLGLEPALGDWVLEPTRIHTLNSMGHNWWTSCVYNAGMLALALQNELPQAREWAATLNEVMPEWFGFAGDVLQNKMKTFDESGGMYESLNYANFGIQEALQYRIAWQNAYPGQKASPIPQLEKLPDYFLQVCYPRTGILYDINFGDSHKNVTAESSMMLLYALGIQRPDMLWYFNQIQDGQHRDGYFRNRPMGFLYMPDVRKAPETPDLPTSWLLKDFGWAMVRDSWKKDATMLAVKSGHTWNHSHADANSLILFHKGVDILKDAGNCSYPNPEYRGYFFQSDAHNVVLFNGEGQSREQQYEGSYLRGSLHHLMDNGQMKYVLANGTGPMADKFSRNFRHFLWMDKVIYVIDDIKAHHAGHFEWLWHYSGKAVKRGPDLTVTSDSASVVIRPLYPRLLALSDFVHDYPEDLYWEVKTGPTEDLKDKEEYYSFHLPGEHKRIKGMTAIILKDHPEDKDLPYMEKREGKDWIGLRVRRGGKVTDMYINQLADGRLMHNNSWIEADGWTTDAYMFTVAYDEGADPSTAGDIFVCYGSALRRGGVSYYSSLSKLFVMQHAEGKDLDVHVQGQPYVRAVFHAASRPSSLRVNGRAEKVVYEDGNVILKKQVEP